MSGSTCMRRRTPHSASAAHAGASDARTVAILPCAAMTCGMRPKMSTAWTPAPPVRVGSVMRLRRCRSGCEPVRERSCALDCARNHESAMAAAQANKRFC